MEKNTQKKRAVRNSYAGRFRPSITMPKNIEKTMYGFDDFISRLAALKEQGNLALSGRRIC